ncbi:MAG: uracil phosphoribosyltransferase [Fuerstiella sp.]|nr:uracil phosphoribosyltransferase [Fuerstiella sp.]MCP4859595.1 uracil phosphoribosyltransferase [Fuerstiella sp.]
MSSDSSHVHELRHSLASHHLSRLRSVNTSPAEFRRHVRTLSTLLINEVTRDLDTEPCSVTTPLETITGRQLVGRIAAVPILRAGLGMVTPLTDLIPDIEVWHLGLYRDEETAEPVRYYDKLPPGNPTRVALVLDPMLATGGSASAAIETLKKWGVPKICMVSIISAPEGIGRLTTNYPDVPIYTCVVDSHLNEQKFIVPGLGDAGDRIFNTLG